MNPNQTYNQFVSSICKPGKDIVESMTHEDAHMLHTAIKLKCAIKELRRRLRQDNAEIDRITEELEKYKD